MGSQMVGGSFLVTPRSPEEAGYEGTLQLRRYLPHGLIVMPLSHNTFSTVSLASQ